MRCVWTGGPIKIQRVDQSFRSSLREPAQALSLSRTNRRHPDRPWHPLNIVNAPARQREWSQPSRIVTALTQHISRFRVHHPFSKALFRLDSRYEPYAMSSPNTTTLTVDRIDEQAEQLDPDFLASLIEIRVRYGVPDVIRLAKFLQRCPKVVYLGCSWEETDMTRDTAITSKVVPLLRTFSGPWPLALHFVPGRPLEKITLCEVAGAGVQPLPSLSDLRSLSSGGRAVRFFNNTVNMPCTLPLVQAIAEAFPNLEAISCSGELGMSESQVGQFFPRTI